jgi:uncharacterized delta-60 repeat protein
LLGGVSDILPQNNLALTTHGVEALLLDSRAGSLVRTGGAVWREDSVPRRTALICLAALALIAALPGVALAASGDLDAGFHGTGIFRLNAFGSGGFSEADALVVSQGKIVVGGFGNPGAGNRDVIIGRLGPNGFPDGACADGQGFRRLDLGGDDFLDNGLAVLSNGKIIFAGYTRNTSTGVYNLFLGRLKANCQVDPKFANGHGVFKADFEGTSGSVAYDLVVLPSGKIIVAGSLYRNNDEEGDVAVWRFNQNGTLDQTFGGGDGYVTVDLAPGYDEAWRVKTTDSGKILVGGWVAVDPTNGYDVMLARFTADGRLDDTFGTDGSVSYDVTDDHSDYVTDMAVVGNKILLCVHGKGPSDADVVLMRLKENGKRDTTFGRFAEVALDYGGNEECHDVAVQADGSIVASGERGSEWLVARILPSGAADLGFGQGGYTTGGQHGSLATSSIDSSGRYLVGGYDSDGKLTVARFLP